MDFDNERDRMKFGFDAGNIIDGVVTTNPETGEFVVVDDEGLAFSTQELLKSLLGKKVRITCISFEAIETIERLMLAQQIKN